MPQTTLLFIDNNCDFNTSIKLIFEKNADWNAMTALNEKDGVAIAQVHQPDVILLDVAVPNLNGLDTYFLLKSNWTTCSIPVIFVTDTLATETIIRSQIAKDVEVISKPSNIKKLKHQIIKACNPFRVCEA